MSEQPLCGVCGEPMQPGEEMFKYHDSLGPCPKPPLPKAPSREEVLEAKLSREKELRQKAEVLLISYVNDGPHGLPRSAVEDYFAARERREGGTVSYAEYCAVCGAVTNGTAVHEHRSGYNDTVVPDAAVQPALWEQVVALQAELTAAREENEWLTEKRNLYLRRWEDAFNEVTFQENRVDATQARLDEALKMLNAFLPMKNAEAVLNARLSAPTTEEK